MFLPGVFARTHDIFGIAFWIGQRLERSERGIVGKIK